MSGRLHKLVHTILPGAFFFLLLFAIRVGPRLVIIVVQWRAWARREQISGTGFNRSAVLGLLLPIAAVATVGGLGWLVVWLVSGP